MRAGRRHVLDAGVRRTGGGRLLVGGAPGRLFRLSPAGGAALDAIIAGEPLSPAATALAERLRAAGTIHPLAGAGEGDPALSFVIPVRDGGASLAPLVRALRAGGEVIVVDDRSGDGSAARAREAGARVIANAGRPGPAGARNTGLGAARTELVAFVDADCIADPGWARALAGLFALEPELALAAPRVRSAPGASALARYESSYSPLDQGTAPSLVGPGRRVGFLPAAAILVRRRELTALGGFDERLRVGEDVDLVLRLVEAGHRVRYAPEVAVAHRPRESLAAFARQRFAYATSAAALERRHPGAVTPARLVRPTLPTARGSDPDSRRALALAAARAQRASAAQLPRLASREWLPLTLTLAAARRRRGAALFALLLLADLGFAARPSGEPLNLPRRAALRLLDNAAYAAGAWAGAIRHRTAKALLPRVIS